MSYFDDIRDSIAEQCPNCPSDLVDLYTLLALVQGVNVTLENVHDAWSIWRYRTNPDHKSLVPFEQLSTEVQELDRPYAEAIVSAMKKIF